MQKNSITNKITPCCGLPFSVVYWWIYNLTLNSESDRQFIISKISQGGIISIDAWKVLINSGTLEADASLTKAEFLAWFDCGKQPKCEQLKLIVEGFKISNWDYYKNSIEELNEAFQELENKLKLKYNNASESEAVDIIQRVDQLTGENVNYREVATWIDGSVMDDEKLDGVIYKKIGNKYYKLSDGPFFNARWFGVKGDGITDDTDAINYAITSVHNIGGGTLWFDAGTYAVSNSINVKSYVEIKGVYAENSDMGVVGSKVGTKFLYTGNGGGSIIRAFNCRLFRMDGFIIDGQGKNVTGILLDSDNNPSGSQNEFNRFSIRECEKGVVWGTSGLGNAYANDGTRFSTFTIWSSVDKSKGFEINSGNAGQMSTIESGGIQVQDIGIHIIVANLLQIRRVFGGGVMDTAFILANTPIDVKIEGSSSEAWGVGRTWRTDRPKFLKVENPVGNYPLSEASLVLVQNQINNPIEINTSINITSIGDAWGYCEKYDLEESWSPNTAYSAPKVISNNNKNYSILSNHTSTNDFNADLTAGKWGVFFKGADGKFISGNSHLTSIGSGVNSAVKNPQNGADGMGWQYSQFVKAWISNNAWMTPPYYASDFIGSGGMTWNVEGKLTTFSYSILNNTMTITFTIDGSTVAGISGYVLSFKIPNGARSAKSVNTMVRATDNGSPAIAWAYTDIDGIYVNIQKTDFTTWSASNGGTTIQGQISFEIK